MDESMDGSSPHDRAYLEVRDAYEDAMAVFASHLYDAVYAQTLAEEQLGVWKPSEAKAKATEEQEHVPVPPRRRRVGH